MNDKELEDLEDYEEEFTTMKKYIADIESVNVAKWVEKEVYEDEDSWNVTYKTKEKPFSYPSMLEKLMDHLDAVGGVEFAILKDPELGRWWAKKVKDREEKRKLKEAKEKLYSTMTDEELKLLGIKTK